MADTKIIRLTPGEAMLINRRRLGETQSQAAKRLVLTDRKSYGNTERGYDGQEPGGKLIPVCLRSSEWCLILRRRANLSQATVAKRAGLSRFTVIQIEGGKVNYHRLVAFWKKYDFKSIG